MPSPIEPKVLVQLTIDHRNAVVIDWTPALARLRACSHDPYGGWENASIVVITTVRRTRTNQVLAMEASVKPKKEINREATAIENAVENLRNVLEDCEYPYYGESLTAIEANANRLKEGRDKEKKILELKRQLATLNGHDGYAFDAPNLTGLDTCGANISLPLDLSLIKELPLDKFVALIRTDKGVYALSCKVETICDHWTGEKHIKIKIDDIEALQEVNVFDCRIFNADGRCIVQYSFQPTKYFVPGDILSVCRSVVQN